MKIRYLLNTWLVLTTVAAWALFIKLVLDVPKIYLGVGAP